MRETIQLISDCGRGISQKMSSENSLFQMIIDVYTLIFRGRFRNFRGRFWTQFCYDRIDSKE